MNLDQKISDIVRRAVQEQLFPGVVVGYVRKGERRVLPFGKLTYDTDAPQVTAETVYDVASVTKSIPTSSIILKLVDDGRLSLDDKVVKFLPELKNQYRDEILIRHLLTFTVYFDIGRTLASLAQEAPTKLMEALYEAPLPAPPGAQYGYSNAPSLMLGVIAERVCGQPLDEIAAEWFFEPLEMRRTTFRPESIPADEVAPTEVDWRGEVRGVVHDPAAWALVTHGRIPGHAGLFSTVPDLLNFVQMLLNGGRHGRRRFFEPATIEAMRTNQTPELDVETGLGWTMDLQKSWGFRSNSGAFGKTGFTGTMLLIDPDKQIGVVVLSNRTYGHRTDWAHLRAFWNSVIELVYE